jgi:hypothetical protein
VKPGRSVDTMEDLARVTLLMNQAAEQAP